VFRPFRPFIPLLILAACARPAGDTRPTVRVGYFPNLTHAQMLVGLARGDFSRALGTHGVIETTVFNAGPSVVEAMMAGRLDLACIGPNPTINGYVQSHGELLRIVSGATSGGAALVVRADAGIARPSDLAGRRLATPQLGNTQDVALRSFLVAHGLRPREQGGTVDVIPTPNPQIVDLIRQKRIDGAWVPEPWASRMVIDAGCVVLIDERDLWPGGEFVTAHIVVRNAFLDAHRDLVTAWVGAHVAVTRWMQANPVEARQVVNEEIEKLTGKALSDDVLSMAWSRIRFTWNPIAPSLFESARRARAAGFLPGDANLDGVYDLSILNDVLRRNGLAEVAIPGSGASP
jgi:NitT/TauT family transport system substrate-binding protein